MSRASEERWRRSRAPLVLDDLHAIGNPSCLDARRIMRVRSVRITDRDREQGDASSALARWRTRGWLQEIGVTDLRLDEQEAQALLRGAGVELDAAQVADPN